MIAIVFYKPGKLRRYTLFQKLSKLTFKEHFVCLFAPIRTRFYNSRPPFLPFSLLELCLQCFQTRTRLVSWYVHRKRWRCGPPRVETLENPGSYYVRNICSNKAVAISDGQYARNIPNVWFLFYASLGA